MLPGIPTALIAPCSTSFHPMFHVLRHFSTLTVEPQTAHRLLAEPLHCPYASPVTGTVLLAIPRSIRDVPFSPLQNALLYFQHPKKKNPLPPVLFNHVTLYSSPSHPLLHSWKCNLPIHISIIRKNRQTHAAVKAKRRSPQHFQPPSRVLMYRRSSRHSTVYGPFCCRQNPPSVAG